MPAADSHDSIQVRGARENNLSGVSLDIPKRRLTVFTGVSGSGSVLAGHDGGRIVFTGTPADLVESSPTITAEHLRAYVAAQQFVA